MNKRQNLILLSMGAMLPLACGKGSSDDTYSGPDDDAIYVETADGFIHADNDSLGAFPGLTSTPNIDDDDQDGTVDWSGNDISADNDLGYLWVETRNRDVEVSLAGDTESIRVWGDAGVILGNGAANTATIMASSELVGLKVEFETWLNQGALTFSDGVDSFELRITSSPLILNHHLQASTDVMMMKLNSMGSTYNNMDIVSAYEEVLGDRFTAIKANKYDNDVWVQDEFEFAYMMGQDSYMEFVIDSIRNGQGQVGSGLDNFPEDMYEGPDFAVGEWGGGRASSLDYGGNLEVTPPVTVNGVEYPFGRVFYGGEEGYHPKDEFRDFLDSQQIQDPFMIDSTWLCVGHVDEFISTVPDASSEVGFKVIVTDTQAAWDILDAMDPATSLSRYGGSGYNGHGLPTVGAITNNNSIRRLNDEIQEVVDAELEIFLAELGLGESDVIRMPSLFEEPRGCGNWVAALIPGMTNMMVSETSDGTPALFMADPFMRSDENDQSSDPIIANVREIVPEGTEVFFVDDWYVYHMMLGEVHCGSNARREPAVSSWAEASHLIEDTLATEAN